NAGVKSYLRLRDVLERMGAARAAIAAGRSSCVRSPSYPQTAQAIPSRPLAQPLHQAAGAATTHAAAGGPIGAVVPAWGKRRGAAFTTSFRTRFADYVSARWPVPEGWGYAFQRRFHAESAGVMVATRSLAADLAGRGFTRLQPWTRGVDMDLFRPAPVRLFGE